MTAKWLALLVLATGCTDRFRADVVRFCDAIERDPGARSMLDLAPAFVDDLKTDEFRDIFMMRPGTTGQDIEARISRRDEAGRRRTLPDARLVDRATLDTVTTSVFGLVRS